MVVPTPTHASNISSGGLLRDHEGDSIVWFISNDGRGDSLFDELYSIFHGIYVIKDVGLDDVVCETDCLEAVSLLQNNDEHKFHPQAASLLL